MINFIYFYYIKINKSEKILYIHIYLVKYHYGEIELIILYFYTYFNYLYFKAINYYKVNPTGKYLLNYY